VAAVVALSSSGSGFKHNLCALTKTNVHLAMGTRLSSELGKVKAVRKRSGTLTAHLPHLPPPSPPPQLHCSQCKWAVLQPLLHGTVNLCTIEMFCSSCWCFDRLVLSLTSSIF